MFASVFHLQWNVVFQDIIQLHISCPSDKEEEKSSKDEYENEEKEKKDKTPRKMLSRGKIQIWRLNAFVVLIKRVQFWCSVTQDKIYIFITCDTK